MKRNLRLLVFLVTGLALLWILTTIAIPHMLHRMEQVTEVIQLGNPGQALDTLRSNLDQEARRLESLRQIQDSLRKPAGAPAVLGRIRSVATNCGLKISTLQGSEPATRDRLIQFPVMLDGTGTFRSWTCLTDAMETGPQITEVRELRLVPSTQGPELIAGQIMLVVTWRSL